MKFRIKFAIAAVISFVVCNAALAQNESERWLTDDPHFKSSVRGESNGNTVRIDITCSAENPDDIKKEAIKSALFMIIFKGFEPGPNGEPSISKLTDEVGLYEQKQAEFDSYLTNPKQGMMNAQAELNRTQASPEVKINKKKLTKSTYTVEVNLENLRADLEGRKLIKPANQSTSGYMPNVVILPSDAWMKLEKHKGKYHQVKDNQGKSEDIYNYKDALDEDEVKKALTEIKSKFEKNFKIIGYKEKAAEIAKEAAKQKAYPESKQMSDIDVYAKVIAADLWIKIDIDNKPGSNKMINQKFVSIEAWNPYTGNTAFTGRQISKETSGDNDWELTKNAIREACDEIRPRFVDFFKAREEKGIEGRVRCSVAESASDLNFNSEVEVNGKPTELKRIIESVLRKETVKTTSNVAQFTPDGDQTPTLINYKDVYIPSVIEEEDIDMDAEEGASPSKVFSANNFEKLANKIKSGLNKKCKITSEIYLKGLGQVEIVITGRKE